MNEGQKGSAPPQEPSCVADVHGGKIREAAVAQGAEPTSFFDFSANINFLGPTSSVVAAAQRAVEEMPWYPLDPPTPLRRAAATFLSVPEEQVLLGNGASELIFLIVAHVRPRRVLVLGPTFTEYERAAVAWGAEVDTVWLPEEHDFRLTLPFLKGEGIAERLQAADLAFLCQPNNPTGGLLELEVRSWFLDAAAEARTPVFVDESFLAFTRGWPGNSVVPEGRDHVIVLHSFTKILAMPGLRVGALVVRPELARTLGPRVPPWNINCVAQAAALAGFSEADVIAATPPTVAAARAELSAGLAALTGIEAVLPGEANFLCVRLDRPQAEGVVRNMRERHNVLIRDLSCFPGMGPRYVRTAVRSPEENVVLLRAFAEVVA